MRASTPLRSGVRAWVLVAAMTMAVLAAFSACGTTDLALFKRDDVNDGSLSSDVLTGTFLPDDAIAADARSRDDGGPTSGELCGAKRCANHVGPKDFFEPDAPANAPALFAGGALTNDPTREPVIRYPNDETMFPVNVAHIRHEWSAGGTNDLFRLQFAGPKTTVTVYTTRASWEPAEEQWAWLAESNRGSAVRLTVEGLNIAAPAQLWRSKSITVFYSAASVEGAIYYWSTGTTGVMKALVSDRFPQKFYTDPKASDGAKCVGCHTLSRDGKRLAVGYDGERLRQVSVPEREVLLPAPGAPGVRESSWTTFSPDGRMILVASKGVLTLLDSDRV